MEFLHDRMSVTSSDDDEADYKYAHLMDKKQYEFQKKLFVACESDHEGGHSETGEFTISHIERGSENGKNLRKMT